MSKYFEYNNVKRSDLPVWLTKSSEYLVILIFVADWSGSETILRGFMEKIGIDRPDLVIYWIDFDLNEDLSLDLGVYRVPTVILLRNGEVVEYIGKILPLRRLTKMIVNHI